MYQIRISLTTWLHTSVTADTVWSPETCPERVEAMAPGAEIHQCVSQETKHIATDKLLLFTEVSLKGFAEYTEFSDRKSNELFELATCNTEVLPNSRNKSNVTW